MEPLIFSSVVLAPIWVWVGIESLWPRPAATAYRNPFGVNILPAIARPMRPVFLRIDAILPVNIHRVL